MKRTHVLVVLDGWGIGKQDESNPIYMAQPQTIKFIEENFPAGALHASGISVGLPWDEEGNSEVGHLTLGAGKVLYQHFPRISLAIQDRTFFENTTLKALFGHAQAHRSAVHFVGLLGEGNVHSAFTHLTSLIELAQKEACRALYLHLFTDGRDSAPQSALKIFQKLSLVLERTGIGVIASVAGRYYGMDRDKHWDRTLKTYQMLIGKAPSVPSLLEALKTAYEKNMSDEYVEPCIIGEPCPIRNGDAVLFFNFREDRMRQLVSVFAEPAFSAFPVTQFSDIFLASLTHYGDEFSIPVVFPTPAVTEPLGKTLSLHNKSQLRVAETEKYAHVTYFFNGLQEEPYPNEYRVLIPSRVVSHHDEYPEMMAQPITERVLASLKESVFDFILVNYANADMIAHTGNYQATLSAIRTIDAQLGRLLAAALEGDHVLMITGDHGNAEVLLDTKTGQPETKHNISPVPFYLVSPSFRRSSPRLSSESLPVIGFLSDVAPTVLELMKLPRSSEMTGQSLIEQLLL